MWCRICPVDVWKVSQNGNTSKLYKIYFVEFLTTAAMFSDWRKAFKSCWGQMWSASVSLMSCGWRRRQTGRQPARCLRIILSDMLRTKRADLQNSASHSNDPEMTEWTVSSRQKDRDPGQWRHVTAEVNVLKWPGQRGKHYGKTTKKHLKCKQM